MRQLIVKQLDYDLTPVAGLGLLAGQSPDYGVLPCGWLPLDTDTFAMDNGGTVKEGVGRIPG